MAVATPQNRLVEPHYDPTVIHPAKMKQEINNNTNITQRKTTERLLSSVEIIKAYLTLIFTNSTEDFTITCIHHSKRCIHLIHGPDVTDPH